MSTHTKLGEFIRAHRERVQPQDVGLPPGGRRRTPGLRREELAQCCEVSPTWLTWLEQGRPVSASGKTLCKLADVMHLSAAERAYLFKLADKLDPSLDMLAETPDDALDAVVDAIATPAYILDRLWNAVAWNGPAEALFTGWLDQPDSINGTGTGNMQQPANLLQFMFGTPAARSLIVDWPDRAGRLVAEFRADCGKHADQEPLAGLIERLTQESADFRQLWTSQHVVDREGGARHFAHPVQGPLTFDQVNFLLAKRHDLKLVILLPA